VQLIPGVFTGEVVCGRFGYRDGHLYANLWVDCVDKIGEDPEGFTMRKTFILVLTAIAWLVLSPTGSWGTSALALTRERMKLVLDFQDELNRSFGCEYVVAVSQTQKYATGSSAGIILVDRDFLSTADSGSLFFAIAHEYAHAYLGHDLQLYQASFELTQYGSSPSKLTDLRRRFEKEADGIAARKAKECGVSLDLFVHFLLTQSDPEKGLSPLERIYSRPKDRVEYIVAVYRSAPSSDFSPRSARVPPL
jgi:hypothetical protein